MQQPNLMRRTVAELFGTYALVTAGCGAIVVNSLTGALGHVGIALTFGLVVMVMIVMVIASCIMMYYHSLMLSMLIVVTDEV